MSALLITIRSTEDGYYHWHIWDGPDGAFEFSGNAPLLERCFEEIIRAQRSLAEHFTADLNPDSFPPLHSPPHLQPGEIHTPDGTSLPAQQDIPPFSQAASAALIYLQPSKSG